MVAAIYQKTTKILSNAIFISNAIKKARNMECNDQMPAAPCARL